MNTYIALLRGINVSGQRKVPMADLRSMLHRMDFINIFTYIQSGNVIFGSDNKDTAILEERIKQQIRDSFGFEVPILVKSEADFRKIIEKNSFIDPEALEQNQVYFVLLKNTPEKDRLMKFEKERFENEKFSLTEECVYLLCEKGYGKAKLNNNLIERKLKVEATTRNYRTMMKLWEMARNTT